MKKKKQFHVIIGVIGEDPHIIGSKILARVLEQEGFKVTHIGAKCLPKEFIEAAVETEADAILISSLSGHARFHCQGLRGMCNEAGLSNIIIYVGGNVGMGENKWNNIEREFSQMGITKVYPPGARPTLVVQDLRRDLKVRVERR